MQLRGLAIFPLACLLTLAACDASVGDTVADSSDSSDSSSDDQFDDLGEPDLPLKLLDYSHELPAHFESVFVSDADNTPGDNQVTDAGATLGRVLFWDKRLSQNGTVSCGSCHDPGAGFSDTVALSEGFEGGLTRRNSMGLINQRYYGRGAMFWDERADTLEDQVLMPIQDAAEMGLTLDELVARVEAEDYYRPLFRAAFDDDRVTEDRIASALAQFVRSMVSYQSKWDEGIELLGGDVSGQDLPNFTDQENRGRELFFGDARCGICHMPNSPLNPPPPGMTMPPPGDNFAIFIMDEPTNNGLSDADDEGVGEVTGSTGDEGTFKSPSLRNIAESAPYMHDGRFETLLEVVDHYSDNVQPHPNLDPRLRDMGNPMQPMRLNLSAEDKAALVAFLEALSDPTLANDERWSDPF